MADTLARRVINGIRDSGVCSDIPEFAETLDAGGIDLFVDLGNENDFDVVHVGVDRQ